MTQLVVSEIHKMQGLNTTLSLNRQLVVVWVQSGQQGSGVMVAATMKRSVVGHY